ncbi:hypothetical protein MMC25_007884 [Agyrium rufum]|nr:hypothetical protein [Agyrium rufum]
MSDNSDKAPPSEEKAQQPGTEPSADNPLGLTEEKEVNESDAYLGKYGNAVGDKVQGVLGKVGGPVGTGLGYAGKPVGGLVEPIVGGLMKSGGEFGKLISEERGQPSMAEEQEEMAKGVGNNEKTGDNPLGL